MSRGLRRHAHVIVNGRRLWMAYRQVLNGAVIAFDKVEVANQIGQTSYEIERLPRIAGMLSRFVDKTFNGKPTRYLLLADELSQPFSDQSQDEFNAMRDDLERAVTDLQKKGAEIIRCASRAEEFAYEMDDKLPHQTINADALPPADSA